MSEVIDRLLAEGAEVIAKARALAAERAALRFGRQADCDAALAAAMVLRDAEVDLDRVEFAKRARQRTVPVEAARFGPREGEDGA